MRKLVLLSLLVVMTACGKVYEVSGTGSFGTGTNDTASVQCTANQVVVDCTTGYPVSILNDKTCLTFSGAWICEDGREGRV